jgi:undecaprenyl-diphosphatase
LDTPLSEYLIAVILGIVEGLTEFIPVSSTGHLILAGALLGFTGERADTFLVFIQLGAILAVVVLYFQRFLALLDVRKTEGFAGLRGIGLLILSVLPAVVVGFFARDFIKDVLFSPLTVAIGLGVGGIAILIIEARPPQPDIETLDGLGWKQALGIGVFQCLSMWPGVSRSAATILGAMLLKVDRTAAAEYSFLVAVPTLLGATLYDLYKSLDILTPADIPVFGIGLVVAFVSALLVIRWFMGLLKTATLKPFGWYRIALAAVVLIVVR